MLWCDAVDGLTSEPIESAGTCGHWSAKDLLGHIATRDQVAIEKVQRSMRGDDRREWIGTQDEFNERMAKNLEDESVASLRKLMDLKHDQFLSALNGASGTSTEHVQAIVEIIPEDTWKHYDVHRQQVTDRFGELNR